MVGGWRCQAWNWKKKIIRRGDDGGRRSKLIVVAMDTLELELVKNGGQDEEIGILSFDEAGRRKL